MRRIFDPSPVALRAQEEVLRLIDLIHEVRLARPLQLVDPLTNLAADIAGEIILGERRRCRVGDGEDPDDVVVAAARAERRRTAGAGGGRSREIRAILHGAASAQRATGTPFGLRL